MILFIEMSFDLSLYTCSCDGLNKLTETTLFESVAWRISVTGTDHYTVWHCGTVTASCFRLSE
jgi:hypothetical protein